MAMSLRPRTLAVVSVLAATALGCGEQATTPLPQVTVTAVAPTEGCLAGGTPITIQGTNFSDVIEVTVGGVDLDYFLVRSTTEITGLVGAVPDVGPADVVVTSRTHGAGTCEGCFSYYDPHLTVTVTAVSPDTATVGSGVAVTITGTGFVDVTSVTVGGTELEERTVVSSTEIAGTVPIQSVPGRQDVAVTSNRTGRSVCHQCFSYLLDVVAQPLAAGGWHSCALATSGAGYCWGWNAAGELGDGTNTQSTSPVAVAGGLTFRAITTGDWQTCALTPSGVAYCWGWNAAGQLGDSSLTDSNTPVEVYGGLTFSLLAADGDFTCGLTRLGKAYCWGWNQYGQLGSTPLGWKEAPTAVHSTLVFKDLTTGHHHTCALTLGGVAYCWGYNRLGSLGDGTYENRSQPAPVLGNATYSLITAGGGASCALTDEGEVRCWGLWPGAYYFTSPQVFGDDFSSVDAGYSHACGISTNGVAFCWGWNFRGQLGDGSTNSSVFTPVAVAGDVEFSRVSGGQYHTCGMTSSGAVYCWGSNDAGQLGNGTLDNSTIPVAVLPFGGSPPR